MDLRFFDWVKRRTVKALFSSPHLRESLVLKGGNLLDIAFGVSTRASMDLDFSIEGEFSDVEQVRAECQTVLQSAFAEEDLKPFDVTLLELPARLSDDLKDFWGGYRVGFKLARNAKFVRLANDVDALRRNAVPLTDGGSTVCKIDISKYEYCAEKQPFVLDGQQIFGYSPEMVVAEKLRAICQQMPEYRNKVHTNLAGRARDFIDIHTIKGVYLINFENPNLHMLLKKVFAAKRVPLHLLGKISDHRDDHRHDFAAVQSTVKAEVELAEFDFYVDYVIRECKALEALWNV